MTDHGSILLLYSVFLFQLIYKKKELYSENRKYMLSMTDEIFIKTDDDFWSQIKFQVIPNSRNRLS